MRRVLLTSVAAVALVGVGSFSASAVTLSNTPNGNSISQFGYPDTQTYGEVFTAPVSGTLTSFTLYLNSGVGSLYGAVGAWNGPATPGFGYGVSADLYQSANVTSASAGAYTFSPNISVTAGQQYVAYLSVYGDPDASAATSMPLADPASNIDYFVFNNSTAPQSNPSWNYFLDNYNVQFSATFNGVSAVPLPASAPMFGAALLALGVAGYGLRRKQAASAA